jgi:hypothetical protein
VVAHQYRARQQAAISITESNFFTASGDCRGVLRRKKSPCREKRGVPLAKGGQMYKLQMQAFSLHEVGKVPFLNAP